MSKFKTFEDYGPQSFQRQMAEIMESGKGHGTRKYSKARDEDGFKEEFDESMKRFLANDNVTKPMNHNEAEKEYVRGKLNAPEEDFTINSAIRRVQEKANRTSGKIELEPLCDLEVAKRLVWESYKATAKKKGFEPVFSNEMKKVIRSLTAYFSGNEAKELDPRKGIYLWGSCGTGKSILMKVIQNVLSEFSYPLRFKMKSVPDLFNDALGSGVVDFSKYHNSNYCFDDLGFDGNTLKHYGNVVNPMEIILSARYIKFQSHGQLTHVTSNLPWTHPTRPSMSGRFDDRILSRGSEMFNFVLLKGDDLRRTP